MTPKSRRSPAGKVGQVVVVGGAGMPGMPVADAEHTKGCRAGIQPLEGGEVGHSQELEVLGQHLDGACAAALPPLVGGPVDVRHKDRRVESDAAGPSKPSGRSSSLSSSSTTWSGGGICSAVDVGGGAVVDEEDDVEPAAPAGPVSSSGPCRSCRCAGFALASSGDGKLPRPPPSPALPQLPVSCAALDISAAICRCSGAGSGPGCRNSVGGRFAMRTSAGTSGQADASMLSPLNGGGAERLTAAAPMGTAAAPLASAAPLWAPVPLSGPP